MVSDRSILDERPTTIRGLADWVASFLAASSPFIEAITEFRSSRSDLLDQAARAWIEDSKYISQWAEVVGNRVDAGRAGRVQFWGQSTNYLNGPIGDARDFYAALTRLVRNLRLWADEDALFGDGPSEDTWVLAPGGQFTAWQKVDSLLTVASEITIVDPYVDLDVLSLVARKSDGCTARVLTDENRRRTTAPDVARLQQEYPHVEVRFLPANALPHDRFLIIPSGVYMSGASLKDVGRRMSVVIRLTLPAAADAVKAEIEAAWGRATQ